MKQCSVCGGEHYFNEMEKFCPTVMAEVEEEFFGKRWAWKGGRYIRQSGGILLIIMIGMLPLPDQYAIPLFFIAAAIFAAYISSHIISLSMGEKEWNKKKEEFYRKKVL